MAGYDVLQFVSTTGLTDDKTSVWTIVLIDLVCMGGVMFVINGKDAVYFSYYEDKAKFDMLSRALLFQFPETTVDSLQYFGLYMFSF